MERERKAYSESELLGLLHAFEDEYSMPSEEFFAKWEKGDLPNHDPFFVWASFCTAAGVRELDFA